ncbi:MAG TPA: hypothetical protein VMY18_03745 [Acidobacteriota bacterium]|nr:hypothetical protein [Acidobacteriota bacterium]HUV12730.1 hypothetical protein [Acidobacteriota bacterium]
MGRYLVRQQSLRISILACIVAAGVSGCASSGLVNVWMDPQYAANPMRNILVVSMQPDVAKRRLWEDTFADALRERGVTATPSYQLFPNELPDTNGIIAAVREHSYDGCIATVKLPSRTLTQDVSGYTTDSLVTLYDPWSHRYYNYYKEVYTPGYTETQKVVRHKIEVWNTTGKGALVWTATSEALDPVSSDDVDRRNRVVKGITDALVRNGVIPAKN